MLPWANKQELSCYAYHQCYKETMLNKNKLSEDLLSINAYFLGTWYYIT